MDNETKYVMIEGDPKLTPDDFTYAIVKDDHIVINQKTFGDLRGSIVLRKEDLLKIVAAINE